VPFPNKSSIATLSWLSPRYLPACIHASTPLFWLAMCKACFHDSSSCIIAQCIVGWGMWKKNKGLWHPKLQDKQAGCRTRGWASALSLLYTERKTRAAQGEECSWIDVATVQGFRRVVMCQESWDEAAAVVGEEEASRLLKDMVTGRLLPTTWLNEVPQLLSLGLFVTVRHRTHGCRMRTESLPAAPLGPRTPKSLSPSTQQRTFHQPY
jgi:hypothetical protein